MISVQERAAQAVRQKFAGAAATEDDSSKTSEQLLEVVR